MSKISERQMSQANHFGIVMEVILVYFLQFNHCTGHVITAVHVALEVYFHFRDLLRRVSLLKGEIICWLLQLLFLKDKFLRLISLNDASAKEPTSFVFVA